MDYYITIKGSDKNMLYTWTIKSFHMSQSDLQWINIKTKVVVNNFFPTAVNILIRVNQKPSLPLTQLFNTSLFLITAGPSDYI